MSARARIAETHGVLLPHAGRPRDPGVGPSGWGMLLAVVCLGGAAAATGMVAQVGSPVGRWQTYDERTGAPQSIVLISEVDGELQGRVARVFSPPAPSENPKCEACTGDRRNQPIVGMLIMWGMKKNGNEYTGGRLFDPKVDKEYRGKLRLVNGGLKLDVRGFIGLSVFGRTQTWVREP
ncbi:MAG: DUF2147 domain-containing protein [Acidobacteriota bacterium]